MNKKLDIKNVELLNTKNRFLNISYTALEEKEGLHSLSINDSCDSISVNKDEVTFVFHRKVEIDDKSLFTIDIQAESIVKFKKENGYTNSEYQKHFEENYIYYYRSTAVASNISLIVGQITAAFGRNPLLVAFKDK